MNPNGTNNKAYKVILANSTTVAKTGTISGVANNLHNVQKSDVNKAKLSTELAMILQSRQRQDFTREWVRNSIKDYLLEQEKMGKEAHTRMLRELQNKEIYHFNCFFSITENQFNFLVRKLKEKITGYNPKRHKKFFTAEERLSITLKYLATGEWSAAFSQANFEELKIIYVLFLLFQTRTWSICVAFCDVVEKKYDEIELYYEDSDFRNCFLGKVF